MHSVYLILVCVTTTAHQRPFIEQVFIHALSYFLTFLHLVFIYLPTHFPAHQLCYGHWLFSLGYVSGSKHPFGYVTHLLCEHEDLIRLVTDLVSLVSYNLVIIYFTYLAVAILPAHNIY